MKPLYLFAYGSMKKNFVNHYRLEQESFIGKAITKEKYNMYPAPSYKYPYGIEDEQKWQLYGELYELITPNIIELIDDFEGAPEHYYRKEIDIFCNNQEYKAYIYFRSKNNPINILDYDFPIKIWTSEFEKAGILLDQHFSQLAQAIINYKKEYTEQNQDNKTVNEFLEKLFYKNKDKKLLYSERRN